MKYVAQHLEVDAIRWTGENYAPDSGATTIRENGQVVAVTRLVAA